MASNGQTHEMMQKCSCSIDPIAQTIPYQEYAQISTLVSLKQMTSAGRNAVYKSSTWSQKAIAKFKEPQADSTLSCF
jgi:ACT domain-containing protein